MNPTTTTEAGAVADVAAKLTELRTSISPQAFNDLPDYVRSYITHLERKAEASQPAELLGLTCDANNGGLHEVMMSGKDPFCPKCGLMLRRHAYTLPHVKPAQFAAALSTNPASNDRQDEGTVL